MSFFRWTGKQVARLPEEITVNESDDWQNVRKSIRQQIYDLIVWGKISEDEFEQWSMEEMKHGRAARCPDTQKTWSWIIDNKYHIHHKNPRRLGGKNEKDNLVITTPLYHDAMLDPDVHYGEYYSKKRKKS